MVTETKHNEFLLSPFRILCHLVYMMLTETSAFIRGQVATWQATGYLQREYPEGRWWQGTKGLCDGPSCRVESTLASLQPPLSLRSQGMWTRLASFLVTRWGSVLSALCGSWQPLAPHYQEHTDLSTHHTQTSDRLPLSAPHLNIKVRRMTRQWFPSRSA